MQQKFIFISKEWYIILYCIQSIVRRKLQPLDKDKTELLARYLSRVFQLHNIQSRIKPTIMYQKHVGLKYISPWEVAQIIDREIKANKAPDIVDYHQGYSKSYRKRGLCYLLTCIMHAFGLNMCQVILKQLK